MAVPFSNTKLRVPKGFQNILECLAREVLRAQPDNIHEFGAAYFENMLKVRAETGHDPSVHGAKLQDRNYNNESFKKKSVDPSDPQQNDAALKIQTQFRQHSAKEEVEAMKEEVAATRIQAGFRGFLDREEVRKMKDGEEEEEVDIDLNDPEVEKAAIKIQAGFKGFKARKDVQGQGESETEAEEETEVAASEPAEVTNEQTTQEQTAGQEEEEVDIDLEDPDVAKAAVKIQAGFKGLKARKELRAKMDQPGATPATTEAPAEPATTEQGKQEEEEVDIDLEDPATEKAALKIQAGFRGYQTRKDLKGQDEEGEGQTESQGEEKAAEEPAPVQKEETEEVDIDLNDPEVEKAATKIQAGFKGFKARKEIQDKAAASAGETQAEDGGGQSEEAPQQQDQAEENQGQAAEGEGQATEEAAPQEEAAPTEGQSSEEAAPAAEGEGQAQEEGQTEAEAPAAEGEGQTQEAAPEAEAAPAAEAAPEGEGQEQATAPEGEGQATEGQAAEGEGQAQEGAGEES